MLDKFTEELCIEDDFWNGVDDGQYNYCYSERGTDQFVARMDLRPSTGQVGMILIKDKKYRNKGMGKEMLIKAMAVIEEWGKTDEIWAVTSQGHEFWSNVFGKQFQYREKVHKSVLGQGYAMVIANHER